MLIVMLIVIMTLDVVNCMCIKRYVYIYIYIHMYVPMYSRKVAL